MMVVCFVNWFIFAHPRRVSWGGSSRAHARALRLVGAGMSGFSPACAWGHGLAPHTQHMCCVCGGRDAWACSHTQKRLFAHAWPPGFSF